MTGPEQTEDHPPLRAMGWNLLTGGIHVLAVGTYDTPPADDASDHLPTWTGFLLGPDTDGSTG